MKKLLIFALVSFVFAGPSMTGDLLLNFYRTGETFARPNLNLFHQTEHFRIWYDTTGYHKIEELDIDPENGMPDFVEKAGDYLEISWQKECMELGFREPLKDSLPFASIDPFSDVGGDDRWDIYLEKMGNGFYGATFIENNIDSAGYNYATGYIKINSDLRSIYGYEDDPYKALAVTCAHEFQHLIQFHYRRGIDDFVWQMEATATYMEEYVFDEINDYYNYVPRFQQDPEKPLKSRGNLYEYGSVLFPIYLAENFGSEIIERWWFYTQNESGFDALDIALAEHSTTLDEEFKSFALWNLHTGRFAIDDFGYEEAVNYPMPSLKDTLDQSDTITVSSYLSGPYSTNYYFLELDNSLHRIQSETCTSGTLTWMDPDSSWAFISAGLGADGCDQELGTLEDSLSASIDELWKYDGLIFAPNYLEDNRGYFDLTIISSGFETTEPEQGPKPCYPNPASGKIYIPFYSKTDTEILIVIYDMNGSINLEKQESVLAGPHFAEGAIEIDISDLASGIYSYIFIMDNEKWQETFIIK